jgi:hypothetical protein
MYLETETLLLLTGVWICSIAVFFALRRRRFTMSRSTMNHLGEIKGLFAEKEIKPDIKSPEQAVPVSDKDNASAA